MHPTGAPFAQYFDHPDIAYLPIVGLPPSRSALLWRRDSADPRVAAFAAVARRVLGPAAPRSAA